MKRWMVPREAITARSLVPYEGAQRRKVDCALKVEPDGRRWRWTVSYELWIDKGPHIGMCYSPALSKRHPKPYTVSGRARSSGDAWVRARRSVALIMSQVAAANNHLDRTYLEHVAA
jgi:hypothetical protein